MIGTLLCFALFLGAMVACLITGQSFLWALALGLMLFTLHGRRQGHTLCSMWAMAWTEGRRVLIVLRIFVFIGAITALWRASGTIVFFISASATERTRDFCGLFPRHIAKYAVNRCIYSTNLSIPFCAALL